MLFDIHNPASSPILLGVRIYDELADDVAAEQRSESFLADRKLRLIPGMNHLEVKLTLGAGETRLIEIEQQHEEARP